MTPHSAILRRCASVTRGEIARVLLLILAFSAWSLTGPANVALALLVAMFLAEVRGHWGSLRREPAFLLLMVVVLITAGLALRAAIQFPATTADQWRGAWAWSAPFLFVVVAWWLRDTPGQVWPLLGAAVLGLTFGTLRRADWSLLPQVLDGSRYDFGQTPLGLAFVASVMLVGLILFRPRITGIQLRGRPRPVLGWTLWALGIAWLLAILIVTQSRGAALGLAIAGVVYAFIRGRAGSGEEGPSGLPMRFVLGSAVLLVVLAATLLWLTKDRQAEDWQALTVGSQGGELSYNGSVAQRINLLGVGFRAFAERPALGFGPGTSTTEFLVPQRLVSVDEYQLANAPNFSHLHSVALEVMTRFGLLGLVIAALLSAVLLRAYRRLWIEARAVPDLVAFLILGGAMLVVFCLYDFRVVNLDLRFFCILFLGVLYSFQIGGQDPPADAEPTNA
jgi:O-antigen ligase